MNFIDMIYQQILDMNRSRFSDEDIARFTHFEHGFDRRTLDQSLKVLLKQGKIKKISSNIFEVQKQRPTIKCVLLGTSKDYAFARAISGDKDNDIYISVADLNDACHGDTVLVEVTHEAGTKKKNDRAPLVARGKREGRVVEILERGYKTIVGILSRREYGAVTIIPDDQRFADSVYVSEDDTMGAENNTKVVAEIVDYPTPAKMARGRVIEILGDPRDARVTTLSIIRSFNLFEEFPDDVVAEAKKVSVPISEEDQTGRKDYRKRLIITIDGDDARDFDDAISVEKSGENYRLGVYIADVSHYVKAGSKLDEEAFKRGTSVYFPDHVLPMLPVELSNGICSLNPNEDRFTLAVEMTISPAGKVLDYEIHKGIICSAYRMTYNKVNKILHGDKALCEEYSRLVPMLHDMEKLSKILIARRDSAGQLDFDIPEAEIELNDDGTVKDIRKRPREEGERLIEQFMVLTNEVIAKHFDDMKVPFVYRVHETPVPERVKHFRDFAGSLGLKFISSGKEPSPKDFQKLLTLSKGKDYSTALSKVMLRSMMKARYDTENLGHFGLAISNYCHFTSPIRRYPDLTIHRIITDVLDGKMNERKFKLYEEFVASSAERSSTTERQAEEAERAVDDQKKAEFMQGKIGETYEGIISGVTENGIYVELDNTVEGFISIQRLPEGRYEFSESRYMLSGGNTTYQIGQKLEIRVVYVDIITRHIDFELKDYHRNMDESRYVNFATRDDNKSISKGEHGARHGRHGRNNGEFDEQKFRGPGRHKFKFKSKKKHR